MMKRLKRSMWLLTVLGLVMMLVVACGGGGGGNNNAGSNDDGGSTAAGDQIVITASDFKFSPSNITFEQGKTYTIVLKNEGPSAHDIVVDEFGLASEVINAGQETTIEFTPDQAGTFEAYCAVPGHRELGMVATFEVK